MSYLQVNIGRNVGNEPMNDDDWEQFQQDVATAIRRSIKSDSRVNESLPFEFHEGQGNWMGAEESCHISLFDERGFDLGGLRADLVHIKLHYRQDAVALIPGSELV